MIGGANLTSGTRVSTASSYVTASISPQPNALIIVSVHNKNFSSTVNVPTISGCGITWTEVTHQYGPSDPTQCVTVFRGMSDKPTPGPLTISFGGQNQDFAVGWSVDQFTNTKKGNPIVQAVSDAQLTTALTLNMANFSHPRNATFGFAMGFNADNNGVQLGSGFTYLSANHEGGGAFNLAEWKPSADTSVDWSVIASSGGPVLFFGIGIEIAGDEFGGAMI